jgi:hypothetical protein
MSGSNIWIATHAAYVGFGVANSMFAAQTREFGFKFGGI